MKLVQALGRSVQPLREHGPMRPRGNFPPSLLLGSARRGFAAGSFQKVQVMGPNEAMPDEDAVKLVTPGLLSLDVMYDGKVPRLMSNKDTLWKQKVRPTAIGWAMFDETGTLVKGYPIHRVLKRDDEEDVDEKATPVGDVMHDLVRDLSLVKAAGGQVVMQNEKTTNDDLISSIIQNEMHHAPNKDDRYDDCVELLSAKNGFSVPSETIEKVFPDLKEQIKKGKMLSLPTLCQKVIHTCVNLNVEIDNRPLESKYNDNVGNNAYMAGIVHLGVERLLDAKQKNQIPVRSKLDPIAKLELPELPTNHKDIRYISMVVQSTMRPPRFITKPDQVDAAGIGILSLTWALYDTRLNLIDGYPFKIFLEQNDEWTYDMEVNKTHASNHGLAGGEFFDTFARDLNLVLVENHGYAFGFTIDQDVSLLLKTLNSSNVANRVTDEARNAIDHLNARRINPAKAGAVLNNGSFMKRVDLLRLVEKAVKDLENEGYGDPAQAKEASSDELFNVSHEEVEVLHSTDRSESQLVRSTAIIMKYILANSKWPIKLETNAPIQYGLTEKMPVRKAALEEPVNIPEDYDSHAADSLPKVNLYTVGPVSRVVSDMYGGIFNQDTGTTTSAISKNEGKYVQVSARQNTDADPLSEEVVRFWCARESGYRAIKVVPNAEVTQSMLEKDYWAFYNKTDGSVYVPTIFDPELDAFRSVNPSNNDLSQLNSVLPKVRSLYVVFDYNPVMNSTLKRDLGAKFDPLSKLWSISLAATENDEWYSIFSRSTLPDIIQVLQDNKTPTRLFLGPIENLKDQMNIE